MGIDFSQGDNGSVEVVRVGKPSTTINAQFTNLIDGHHDEIELRRLARWLESDNPGTMALWGDRERLTNAGRHFQLCVHDPQLREEIPRGPFRRNYTFRFVAPSEGAA